MLCCMSDRCNDLAIAETQRVKRVMNGDGDAKDLMCMPWQAGSEEWMVNKSIEEDRTSQEATGTLTAQEGKNFGSLLAMK